MGVIDNLGFIRKAAHFGCAAPNPVLIMEAAANAIGPVLLNASTFGCNDIIKMRAGISPWHSRGIRALINGAIPPDEAAKAGSILKFTIPLEKALFFMFVVDLTVDFFARWQSQVFKLNACGDNLFNRTGNGPMASYVEPSPGNWALIAYDFTWTGSRFGSSVDFGVPANWWWSAFFSLTVKPLVTGQPVGSMTTRLLETTSGGFAFQGEPNTPDWFGNPVSSRMFFEAEEPKNRFRQFRFQASCDAPAIGTGGAATVQISNRPVMRESIIPMNCLGKGPINENLL